MEYGESKCPKCGTIFSIRELLKDEDFMQMIKEESYFLGVKHGAETVERENRGK